MGLTAQDGSEPVAPASTYNYKPQQSLVIVEMHMCSFQLKLYQLMYLNFAHVINRQLDRALSWAMVTA